MKKRRYKKNNLNMKKILLLLIFSIFLLTLVKAEVNPCGNDRDFIGWFEKGENTSLIQTCDNCTYVNVSKFTYPNSTFLILNGEMTKNGIEYNYSWASTSVSGCHSYTVVGDKNGISNRTETFDFIINPTGIQPSESRTESVSRSIYFTLVMGILFFIGFLFVKTTPTVKWTFFIFGIFFFLITLNILFVGLQDEVVNPKIESFFDSFTAISFYVYWFLAGVLIIMWFLAFIQTWLYNKNQKALSKYGS